MNEAGDTDYKKGQQFAKHMKEATHATSDFAVKKSILQQRQYLPVFAVRQEVIIISFQKRWIHVSHVDDS